MADNVRIEELRRRVELDPASIAFAALAEEYRRGGQFEDAIAICETGLQRHPAYLSARVTLGRSLLETGRFEEARAQLEQVLRSAPENLAAIRGLAEIHHRAGDVPESAESAASYANSQLEPQPEPQPEPVRVPVPVPVPDPGPSPQPPSASPLHSQPIRVSSVPADDPAPMPAVRTPHPDELALAPLENFLAAIVAARSSAGRYTT
jgi:tetratricopeptide (TPR) repeat protein